MAVEEGTTQQLARQLKWSADDTRLCLEAVTRESKGMTPAAAAQVIQVLNQSVVEMSPAMATVIVLAAGYHMDAIEPNRNEEIVACG